jgi:hypothetical protein
MIWIINAYNNVLDPTFQRTIDEVIVTYVLRQAKIISYRNTQTKHTFYISIISRA